jgi:hypothetical protein
MDQMESTLITNTKMEKRFQTLIRVHGRNRIVVEMVKIENQFFKKVIDRMEKKTSIHRVIKIS